MPQPVTCLKLKFYCMWPEVSEVPHVGKNNHPHNFIFLFFFYNLLFLFLFFFSLLARGNIFGFDLQLQAESFSRRFSQVLTFNRFKRTLFKAIWKYNGGISSTIKVLQCHFWFSWGKTAAHASMSENILSCLVVIMASRATKPNQPLPTAGKVRQLVFIFFKFEAGKMDEGDLKKSEQLPCSVRAAVFGCTTVFWGHGLRPTVSKSVRHSSISYCSVSLVLMLELTEEKNICHWPLTETFVI